MPESQEAPKTTPAPKPESLPNPEKLLGGNTGEQALWLLGKRQLDEGKSLTDYKEQITDSVNKGIPQAHKEKINNASFNERTEYWKNTPEAERMGKWETSMDGFLKPIKEDTNKTAETFLKNILKKDGEDPKSVAISAKNIYDTFMKDGKGDMEFFVKRIVKENSFEEIEKNIDLIKNLGKIYGTNSAKISELLTHGMANAKKYPEAFITSAQDNLNQKNYGDPEIWTKLDENSGSWEVKEKQKEDARKAAEAAKLQKEKDEAEKKDKKKHKKKQREKRRKIMKKKLIPHLSVH